MGIFLVTHAIVLRLARPQRLNTYRYVSVTHFAFISLIAAIPFSLEKDRNNTGLLCFHSLLSPFDNNGCEYFRRFTLLISQCIFIVQMWLSVLRSNTSSGTVNFSYS